ncbi:unnamed protein product [Ectocarpus sp. CCAP 1310/34]|nr:unnamed protein product [Ectocarpus sp. CCAP 1310/34]
MHQYLLTFCLIGRPCSSEDPDLRTARKTSGPNGRGASGAKGCGGTQKAKKGSPGTSDESGSESGAYTEIDLSSNAIRMFTGAGEIESLAQVKETAAVAAANAQLQARRVQETNTGKLVTAVEALSAAVVSRQSLDEEAAGRARLADAREAKKAKIADLKGMLEYAPSEQKTMELRAAIMAAYEQPDSYFLAKPISAATPPGAGAALRTSASTPPAAATRASTAGVGGSPAPMSSSPAAATPVSAAGVASSRTPVSSSPATATPTSSAAVVAPVALGATQSATRPALPGFTGARKRGGVGARAARPVASAAGHVRI